MQLAGGRIALIWMIHISITIPEGDNMQEKKFCDNQKVRTRMGKKGVIVGFLSVERKENKYAVRFGDNTIRWMKESDLMRSN